MLEKQDFEQWNFHNLWNQCFEENGNGARIRLPIKVHLNLSWSPKFSAVENGTLANSLRMPLEKLTADFVHIFLLSAKTLWGWYSVASYWDFCTVLQSPAIFLILSAVSVSVLFLVWPTTTLSGFCNHTINFTKNASNWIAERDFFDFLFSSSEEELYFRVSCSLGPAKSQGKLCFMDEVCFMLESLSFTKMLSWLNRKRFLNQRAVPASVKKSF